MIMGQRTWRVLGMSVAVFTAALACAVAEYGSDADDQPEDARAEDARAEDGGCNAVVCLRTCLELGLAGGSCFEGECLCVAGDGPPADGAGDTTGPDDGGSDTPPTCDPATCDSACRSVGYPGGSCDAGLCRCTSTPDADADVDGPVDDADVDDGSVDDGTVDDGAVDDAPVDDGAVDDAPVDDGAVDDAPVDDGSTDDSGGLGRPRRDTTGGVLSDRGIIGGATRLTRTVTVPALGNGRAVRLEITINSRRLGGLIPIPFDDIQATLQSPSGTNRKFWYHFDGDTSGMLGDYNFFTPWVLPIWWDSPVGGTWTLTLQDDVFTSFGGANSTLVSWCVVPLDPASYASTDTGARLASCDTASRTIEDYECASDGTNCEHPLMVQMQVTNLVRATGAPVARIEPLTATSATSAFADAADGTETTLWNRGPGPLLPLSPRHCPRLDDRPLPAGITDMVV